jgi:transcriptional regulator with XRE-family HTH domain
MDVGLPSGSRRRVRGLRRGEVAELVGVSDYWYRAFESGRAARVSPRFVARLASVLRLTLAQRISLIRLSLPEIYFLLSELEQ